MFGDRERVLGAPVKWVYDGRWTTQRQTQIELHSPTASIFLLCLMLLCLCLYASPLAFKTGKPILRWLHQLDWTDIQRHELLLWHYACEITAYTLVLVFWCLFVYMMVRLIRMVVK